MVVFNHGLSQPEELALYAGGLELPLGDRLASFDFKVF
jgi:hypothetical protein